MAYVTGIGLVILVCIAMPIDFLTRNHQPVAIVGALHGFFYMAYVVCTLVLAERCRWRPVRAVLVALAGTVPFVSFYAERKVTALVRALPPRGQRPRRGDPRDSRSVGPPEGTADQQPDLRT